MSPETIREEALEIIKMIDYDMWKETKYEPDEWELVLQGIENKLIDVFNEGYALAEVDWDVRRNGP
jgi:hypothetical protein